MLYNFLFTKSEEGIQQNTVFTPLIDISNKLNDENYFILSYKLNDHPFTKKWIEQHFFLRRYYNVIGFDSNTYTGNVNDMIEKKNNLNYICSCLQIPKGLYLDDSADPEHEILNKLHYIFESNVINYEHGSEPRELWEDLYSTIHQIENLANNDYNYFVLRPQFERNHIAHMYKEFNLYPTLEITDYDSFDVVQAGDLCLDYSTIGKDLFSCSLTDDMALIENNKVSQQTALTDNVACCFANMHMDAEVHYKWCEDNNVDKYLNYRDPLYTPGRAILGKNTQEIFNVEQFHRNVLRDFPKFVGSYMSTDKNTEIIDYV